MRIFIAQLNYRFDWNHAYFRELLPFLCEALPKLNETTYTSYTSVGEKWGSNNRRNVFEFLPGNNATHTIVQESQSLFDSAVTEISARNEFPIQSLLEIIFRNDVSGY